MLANTLSSRQSIIERIELQFAYEHSAVCLIGEVGSGKSYLLDRFLTDKYESDNKAFISPGANTTDKQLYSQLLEQIFGSVVIDYNVTLLENFKLLQSEENNILIVIDNSNHLTPEFCSDLEQLIVYSKGQIKILLASTRQLHFQQVINIHLEPLNFSQSIALLSQYHSPLPYSDEPIFKAFVESCKGNAKLLLQWQQQDDHEKRMSEGKVKQWFIYAVLTLLLILTAGIISALYYYDKNKTTLQNKKDTLNNLTQPITVATALETTQLQSIAENPQAQQLSIAEKAIVVSKENEITTDAKKPPNKAQLTEQSQQTEQLQQAEQSQEAERKLESTVEQSRPEITIKSKPTERKSDTTLNSTMQPEKEITESGNVFDNAWFLAQAEDKLMLQLVAAADRSIIENLKQSYPNLHIRVYLAQRYGGDWHVALIGPYTSHQQANIEKAKLDQELIQLQPFVKSIKQIKQEISE